MLKGKYKIVIHNEENSDVVDVIYSENLIKLNKIINKLDSIISDYEKENYKQCKECNLWYYIDDVQEINEKTYCDDCVEKKIGGFYDV